MSGLLPSLLLAFLLALIPSLAACQPAMNKPLAYAQPFTAQSDLALLAQPKVLPRNINLQAFDPHRPSFACVREAERIPSIQDPKQAQQAQLLYEQAMALTSPALWPSQHNWPQAVQLWQQAWATPRRSCNWPMCTARAGARTALPM